MKETAFNSTWSDMVNFMAVTTVVRLSAECEDKAARKSGRSLGGSIRHSLPRHSATTLRVPAQVKKPQLR
jgi:hypothetical protein